MEWISDEYKKPQAKALPRYCTSCIFNFDFPLDFIFGLSPLPFRRALLAIEQGLDQIIYMNMRVLLLLLLILNGLGWATIFISKQAFFFFFNAWSSSRLLSALLVLFKSGLVLFPLALVWRSRRPRHPLGTVVQVHQCGLVALSLGLWENTDALFISINSILLNHDSTMLKGVVCLPDGPVGFLNNSPTPPTFIMGVARSIIGPLSFFSSLGAVLLCIVQ